ncbi:MotE family protein [Minwuia sp.]|uniref:MotE family protein n=1 Tax=Minwuia sp. TaxID=2493630 RepID=UPI003A8C9541
MKIFQIRLLPVTLLALVMVLGVRVSSLTTIFEQDGPGLVAVPQAFAAAETEPDEADARAEADGTEVEKLAAAEKTEAVTGTLAGRDPTTFSPSEIALLENLARRRDEIEKRASALDVRENLLAATESRIDEKIDTLKALEQRIDTLVEQHDEAEEKRMARLVTVYEKMKAKDAARIFEEIELDILLDVTARMKESKVAEVLAEMSPQRAQELTIALATRDDLESRIKP